MIEEKLRKGKFIATSKTKEKIVTKVIKIEIGEERKDWVGGQNQTPLYICVLY